MLRRGSERFRKEVRAALGCVALAAGLWVALPGRGGMGQEALGVDDAGLRGRLEKAQALPVEDVCEPVKSVRVGETMLVPNPDGKSYDILQWYFRGYGGPTAVYIVDLASGEVKKGGIPLGRQIHICGRVLGPDGKLYITTPDWQKGMELYVYDPAKSELSCRGVIAPGLGGENRPMVIGTDGMIYGGGSYAEHGKAGAYQLNAATGEVVLYGPVGPSHKPAGVWCQSLAADDDYVYVPSGKVPWYLIAVKKKTGEQKVLLETDRMLGQISVRQLTDGCTASASHIKGLGGETVQYWLREGRAIEKKGEQPPWVERKAPAARVAEKPELYLERLDPDTDGNAELWYRTPEAKVSARRVPGGGGHAQGTGWKVVQLKVDVYPMLIRRLTEIPDGRLLGTADSYLGNFVFDPRSGRCEHLGKIALSHYSTAFAEGKVYMSGYPSSPVYVYDPGRPWTVARGRLGEPAPVESAEGSNPRLLARLMEFTRTHKMYAAAVGADGRIYFGGQCMRNANGGGIGWWDSKAGKAGGLWRPFTAYGIHYMTAADGGNLLVASTAAVRDDSEDNWTPAQGKVFVYDIREEKIVREIEPVPNAKDTGPIVEARPGYLMGTTIDPTNGKQSVLYGVDVRAGAVTFAKRIPALIGFDYTGGRFDFRIGPDGEVWTYMEDVLVRIDPRSAAVTVVGRVTSPGRLAFSGDNVFLAGTERLRRIGDVAKERN